MEILKDVVFNMSPDNEPIAYCKTKEEVIFKTQDCFGGQIETENMTLDELDWDNINPATGPLYIEDAEVGDVLKVKIKEINLNNQGAMTTVPEMGYLAEYLTGPETKVVKIKDRKAVFNEKIKLPIEPMIGVMGVAPAVKSIDCGTPGSHGGNMDTKVIKEGATVYFPVNVPGALLSMGDMHAVMGDGEVVICGVEIAGEARVEVEVLKDKNITNPVVEDKSAFYTIASAEDLDQATKRASDDMFKFLKERLPLSANEIAMLMSLICDLQISQVVDPAKTARMRVDKNALKKYDLKF
jgi:amidase